MIRLVVASSARVGFMAADIKKVKADYNAAIGDALGRWAGVEWEVCRLFCKCVNAESTGPAMSGYWAVASFDARLKMTDAAVRTLLIVEPKAINDEWNAINNHLVRKNRTRNKLAHGSFVMTGGTPEDEFFFVPYYWASLGKVVVTDADDGPELSIKEMERLDLKQIGEMSDGFYRLGRRLAELTHQVEQIALRIAAAKRAAESIP